jgi:hypothetical protein
MAGSEDFVPEQLDGVWSFLKQVSIKAHFNSDNYFWSRTPAALLFV